MEDPELGYIASPLAGDEAANNLKEGSLAVLRQSEDPSRPVIATAAAT